LQGVPLHPKPNRLCLGFVGATIVLIVKPQAKFPAWSSLRATDAALFSIIAMVTASMRSFVCDTPPLRDSNPGPGVCHASISIVCSNGSDRIWALAAVGKVSTAKRNSVIHPKTWMASSFKPFLASSVSGSIYHRIYLVSSQGSK
jgi:hypothetical protein